MIDQDVNSFLAGLANNTNSGVQATPTIEQPQAPVQKQAETVEVKLPVEQPLNVAAPQPVINPTINPMQQFSNSPLNMGQPTNGVPSYLNQAQSLVEEAKKNIDKFGTLEAGHYKGILDAVELTTSKKNQKMLKFVITLTEFKGLEFKGSTTIYKMLEHSNPMVVTITLQNLIKMLNAVDMNLILNDQFMLNLTKFLGGKTIRLEATAAGFTNFTEFNGKKM